MLFESAVCIKGLEGGPGSGCSNQRDITLRRKLLTETLWTCFMIRGDRVRSMTEIESSHNIVSVHFDFIMFTAGISNNSALRFFI